MPHWRVLGAGVVLSNPHQKRRQYQAHHRGTIQTIHRQIRIVCHHGFHDPFRDWVKSNQGQHACHRQATIERIHDVATIVGFYKQATNYRGNNREATEHQRIHDNITHAAGRIQNQRTQHHRCNNRHRVGLKQIGGHTRAISHVVAHVVSDHCRIARIVFRNACFNFAHQISTYIRTLGENAAAQARKNRNQRRAKRQTNHGLDDVAHLGTADGRPIQHIEKSNHAQQAQADHQQARDGTAFECNIERRIYTATRCLSRSNVGPHRHIHADKARQPGRDRTHRKARRRQQP